MRLAKVFSLLFILASVSVASAADNAASSTTSESTDLKSQSSGSSPFLVTPDGKLETPGIVRAGRGQRVELSPFAGVCFTMRSYKVKRTERLRDDESGAKGYSTCEMGSNYRVRSADDYPAVKLK